MNEGTRSIWRSPLVPGDDATDSSEPPELGEEFFRHAQLRGPMIEKYSALVDREVYEWFQKQGPDSLQRMNQVLRDYMVDVQRNAAASEGG